MGQERANDGINRGVTVKQAHKGIVTVSPVEQMTLDAVAVTSSLTEAAKLLGISTTAMHSRVARMRWKGLKI